MNPDLRTLNSPLSRKKYASTYREFGQDLTADRVLEFIARGRDGGSSPATINRKLSALKFAARSGDWCSKDDAAAIEAIAGIPMRGVRTGNWLSLVKARELLDVPGTGPRAARDRAFLAMLVGAALRRAELVSLQISHLQTIDGRLCVMNLRGKGGRVRTVPLPEWCVVPLNAWIGLAGITSGPVWLRVFRSGAVGRRGLGEHRIHTLVQEHGARIGVPGLAPHDLRRTFAQLARKGSAPIEQIKETLGHSSIETTERYLGGKMDLENPACDAIRL